MSNEKPGCLGIILQALGLLPKDLGSERSLPYMIRDDFLSPSELSFFRVLKQVVGNKAHICCKVALKDLFFVSDSDRRRHTIYANKINLKHVDFLLCAPDTLKPLCGIELDDSSHQRTDRVARDLFVDKVFTTAGLKLIRFENKKSYALPDIEAKIKQLITPVINQTITEKENSLNKIEAAAINTKNDIPMCPKCQIPMILRQAKRGQNKGQQFYGCTNYPKCREVIYMC